MEETTTIRISITTKNLLDENKLHPRETYDDEINRMIKDLVNKKGGIK